MEITTGSILKNRNMNKSLKHPLQALLLTSLLLGICLCKAQSYLGLVPDLTETPTYKITGLGISQIYLKMPYSKSEIENPEDLALCKGNVIESIDLVYTDYPKSSSIEALNTRRFAVLRKNAQNLFTDPGIRWRIVKQTACKNEMMANSMFHGFVITFRPAPTEESMTGEVKTLAGYASGKYPLRDSTVLKVMNRNREWNEMLIVCDVTGSMSPYTSQVLLWQNLNMKKKRVKNFVFFNDGDNMPDDKKVIGKTGGIYDTTAQTIDGVIASATKAMRSGFGGDGPENNVEALLYGNRKHPDCDQVVMIADNGATPRDLILAKELKKPVKIILCGTKFGINTAYLDLARTCGGSVHTIEEDILNMADLKEGDILTIGKETFEVRGGKFTKILLRKD
jgi:hypothetical protein